MLLMDLMSLNSKTVLHIVCKDTLLGPAVFVNIDSTGNVWSTFFHYLINLYVDHSTTTHAEFVPQFHSEKWNHLPKSCDVKRHTSGAESHNALGVRERYHEYLRQVYRKVRAEHKGLDLYGALSLSIRAINCTAGTERKSIQ